MREEHKQIKNAPNKEEDLQVTKLSEGVGKYQHGADLRGNVVYANTKIHKHWKSKQSWQDLIKQLKLDYLLRS